MKGNITKPLLINALILFSFNQSFAQSNGSKFDNLKNNPFQFGFEGGVPVELKNVKNFTSIFAGYMGIRLSANRKTWVRFEGASLKLNESGKHAGYLSFLINYVLVSGNKHTININGGITLYGEKGSSFIAPALSLQYLYSFNKVIGLSASIKMPLIKGSYNQKVFINPFIVIGVQLF